MEMIVSSAHSSLIPVADQSQIGDARRRIGAQAQALGFDETQRGQIEIIASELATNVWLHGGGGALVVRSNSLADGLEILAVDRGPGMQNVEECLRDGFSTAGTAGNGLGAIRRLAQVFDIYSRPREGTVVLAQCLRSRRPGTDAFAVGGVCLPIAGEQECGDAWSCSLVGRRARVVVADGLGHGPDASVAANRALHAIGGSPTISAVEAIETAHRAIAGTRGAAIAVCDIDPDAQVARFAGVGNIAAAIVAGPAQRSLVSHNGIVGHQMRKVQEFQYPWSAEALLVLHSDGIQSRWSFDSHPGLTARHPSVIAAVLNRDHARGRDDATAVVLRNAR